MTEHAGKCANCEYQSDTLNERDYCPTCWSAYDAGYQQALFEKESVSK